MRRLLDWLWGRAALFALLVAAFAFTAWVWPGLPQVLRHFEQENLSAPELAMLRERDFAGQQAQLEQRTAEARSLGAAQIADRIAARKAALAAAQAQREAASAGVFAAYRPSQIAARSRAEIGIAAATSELAMLETALAPRRDFEAAQAYLAANPQMPTARAIAASQARCTAAKAALARFDQRFTIDQGLREAFLTQRTDLTRAAQNECRNAAARAQARKAALAAAQELEDAHAALAALRAAPLPASLIADPGRATLRDIIIKALLALIFVTLTPFAYRTIAYFVLAPIAARAAPLRFAPAGSAPPQPVAGPSAVSAAITLGPREEALVRQDYLQSSSLTGAKRTRWLLDWRHPLTSLASGMRFLTAISGDGERVTVSAVKDPFAELAVLTVPAGAACVLRPSALAAVVQPHGAPMMIRSQWRFALPAWLTWQWRYMVFHGPVRLVVKGGRGVRIEPAARGRIVGEGQMLGFSTDLAYAVIRSETFWPYFFGREALLKDRVASGAGVLLIEEAPLAAGHGGLRRGLQGVGDALLKVAGI